MWQWSALMMSWVGTQRSQQSLGCLLNKVVWIHRSYFRQDSWVTKIKNILKYFFPFKFFSWPNPVTQNWAKNYFEKILKSKMFLSQIWQIFFLTISYLFSIPINCSNLKFHCPLEVLHMEKIGKNIFPGWKKNCSTWKNIFPSWNNYFFHFSTRKDRKSLKNAISAGF